MKRVLSDAARAARRRRQYALWKARNLLDWIVARAQKDAEFKALVRQRLLLLAEAATI